MILQLPARIDALGSSIDELRIEGFRLEESVLVLTDRIIPKRPRDEQRAVLAYDWNRERFRVVVSRDHVSNGLAQAVVVISKNSNVATGQAGHDDAVEVATGVGDRLGVVARERLGEDHVSEAVCMHARTDRTVWT